MTVQIIGIAHRDSNIRQAIFFDKGEFRFQGTSFGNTRHRPMSHAAAYNTLRIWRDLFLDDNLTVTHEDTLTLKSLFDGAEHLEMITGAAPAIDEEA